MRSVIEQWLNDPSVERIKDDNSNIYAIRVLGRGENLFFQENGKALICEIDAINSILYTDSIKNWSGCKKMDKIEKDRVINLIKYYYLRVYKNNLILH